MNGDPNRRFAARRGTSKAFFSPSPSVSVREKGPGDEGQNALKSIRQPHLWQEARDRGSRPKPGHKYASKAPRYCLDEYIKRQYADRVYLLIWDEIHEAANGDTGNGEAFGRLAGVAKKILAMTGTPFNGKASSLFNIEYHLNERVRQRYPWGGADKLAQEARLNHGLNATKLVTTTNHLMIAGSREATAQMLDYAHRAVRRAHERGYTVIVGDNPKGGGMAALTLLLLGSFVLLDIAALA